jgi:hypothetical protein
LKRKRGHLVLLIISNRGIAATLDALLLVHLNVVRTQQREREEVLLQRERQDRNEDKKDTSILKSITKIERVREPDSFTKCSTKAIMEEMG